VWFNPTAATSVENGETANNSLGFLNFLNGDYAFQDLTQVGGTDRDIFEQQKVFQEDGSTPQSNFRWADS
jgi:hypothetical protein